MPKGKYPRSINQRIAISNAIKAMWARRSKHEKTAIGNKISQRRAKTGHLVKG